MGRHFPSQSLLVDPEQLRAMDGFYSCHPAAVRNAGEHKRSPHHLERPDLWMVDQPFPVVYAGRLPAMDDPVTRVSA